MSEEVYGCSLVTMETLLEKGRTATIDEEREISIYLNEQPSGLNFFEFCKEDNK